MRFVSQDGKVFGFICLHEFINILEMKTNYSRNVFLAVHFHLPHVGSVLFLGVFPS